MAKYILKRVGYAVLTILVLIGLTFMMMHMLPGDPFMGDKAVSEVTRKALEAKFGLDKSLFEQFIIYIKNLLQGDMGTSINYNRPVTKIILGAFPYSFELGVRALIISVVFGLATGVLAAVKRGSALDSGSMFLAVVGVSIPSFVMAALLQYLLGLKLRQWFGIDFFPITGWKTEAAKILPALALSFSSMARIARLMRTSMLDVLSSDYIKTAKAKGLSQGLIIKRHAIRNAIMPVITVLGPIAASVLTGAFVVENIFSIPGTGKFLVLAINTLDYPLIAGTTLFYGTFLIIANLVVDICYGIIDPRVDLVNAKE